MDSTHRSQIRSRARALFLITELVLAAALAVALQSALEGWHRGETLRSEALYGAPLKLLDVNRQLMSEKALQLMAFPPPANAATRYEWARAIRSHMGFPVAVFAKSDTAIHWISVPDFLLPHTGDAPRAFDRTLPGGELAQTDSLGLLVIWRGNLGPDSAAAALTAFTQGPEAEGWGIVYLPGDGLAPLLRSLATGASRPRRMLRETLQVDATDTDRTYHTGLRAFDGDELIYATSHVDTTREHREIEWGDIRAEFYLSDRDLEQIRQARGLAVPAAALIAALMLVVWLFYRWIGRLTRSLP